jgi:hypothetical protein
VTQFLFVDHSLARTRSEGVHSHWISTGRARVAQQRIDLAVGEVWLEGFLALPQIEDAVQEERSSRKNFRRPASASNSGRDR